jgi:protein-S-isoprenylcysteine O-methyltransferase Ste14
MTSSDVQALTSAGAATCWAVVVLVWVAGAVYNAVRGPKEARRQPRSAVFVGAALVSVIVAAAVLRAVPDSSWRALTVESPRVKALGSAVLICSTAFAMWARAALGTMWSIAPVVKEDHELRTDGPYGVTRHPIYTGLLGMLLGTVLVAGLGRSLVILPVALVLFEIKLREEERLLRATFPADYSRYRRRVPQLVPGLRRRHHLETTGDSHLPKAGGGEGI